MNDRSESEVDHDEDDDEYINERVWQWVQGLVQDACDLYEQAGVELRAEDYFRDHVLPVRESFEPSVKEPFQEWKHILDEAGDDFTPQQQQLMMDMVAIHLGTALYHADRDDDNSAWEEVNFANHWLSLMRGYLRGQKKNPPPHSLHEYAEKRVAEVLKRRHSAAAIKGHAADHANEKFAGDWLNEHFYQDEHTNTSAAEELGKVVTGAFDTRLGYVKRWRKSRRLQAT